VLIETESDASSRTAVAAEPERDAHVAGAFVSAIRPIDNY